MTLMIRLSLCAVFLVLMMAASPDRARAAESSVSAMQNESELIGVLQSGAPADRAMACKRLTVYGTPKAVPALAALLPDAELASWARIALEAIPGPAADAALRQSLGKLKGRLLVGAINSLGVRRDAQAVGALAGRLKDADPAVASAAAVALGRIANAPAAKALEESLAGAPAAVRGAVAQGCNLCAEKAMAAGNREEAVRLYDLVRQADVPTPRILEAIRGAILARQAAGVPLLVEQLRSANRSLLAIGLSTARELPGREATDALVAELGTTSPDRQALLILALADRGDPAALGAMLQAAKTGRGSVRIAALRVLERVGNASCVPVLLEAAQESEEDVAQTAADALAGLPGKDVDADLGARLPKAQGKARQVLIRLIGERRIEAAAPTLLKAVDDPDPETRAAALVALGATIGLDDLPVLIARVAKPAQSDDAKAAEQALTAACTRMPDREACAAKLIAAMADVPVATKCKFLEVLGSVGGTKALAALGAAAKDPSAEICDVATRVLGEWMSADAAPVLLDAARGASDPKFQVRALRGYLRIARQLRLPTAQRLAMCREALKLSQRNEEKKLVLEVLRRNPCREGLTLAVSLLDSAGAKADAGATAVAIGEKIVEKEPAAVADAMKQVLQAGNRNAAAKAKALLERASQK